MWNLCIFLIEKNGVFVNDGALIRIIRFMKIIMAFQCFNMELVPGTMLSIYFALKNNLFFISGFRSFLQHSDNNLCGEEEK